MLFKIRASDWTNLPVDFSTGKFGALHLQLRRPRRTLGKSIEEKSIRLREVSTFLAGTTPKCLPTGGVRLQEVSVSGGSTVISIKFRYFNFHVSFSSRVLIAKFSTREIK